VSHILCIVSAGSLEQTNRQRKHSLFMDCQTKRNHCRVIVLINESVVFVKNSALGLNLVACTNRKRFIWSEQEWLVTFLLEKSWWKTSFPSWWYMWHTFSLRKSIFNQSVEFCPLCIRYGQTSCRHCSLNDDIVTSYAASLDT